MHHTTARRLLSERRRRGEHGYVLMTAAMLLIPMLAVAGLAIDLGGWYNRASKMQRAADAAALAGVVWLPNIGAATTTAQNVAKANGFDDAKPNITVAVSQVTETEIKVVITDTATPVYIEKFWANTITVSRTATAKYVLPVPLGSPKNYFGTGPMISGSERENFYAAMNGVCWGKVQGGPFEVRFKSGASNGCSDSGRTDNPEYKGSGDQYEYYVDLPAGRSQPVIVHIWNPAGPSVDSTDPGRAIWGSNVVTTTYQLRAPDSTPFDDSDNPVYACTGAGETNPRTYTATDNDATLLGQAGWSRFCTIPTTAPAGKYIFGLKNDSAYTGNGGAQLYALMASYNGSGTTCDGRTDTMCPRVYAKNWMSIGVAAPATASFYLAEIGPEHKGKKVKITLFDPGEGGNDIRIKTPSGTYASFTYQDFGVDGTTPGTLYGPTTSLTVTGGIYNGKYVELTIDLPLNYDTLYSQWWWKIEYNFTSSANDRTTWGVRVVGDPVHLTS